MTIIGSMENERQLYLRNASENSMVDPLSVLPFFQKKKGQIPASTAYVIEKVLGLSRGAAAICMYYRVSLTR